MLAQLALDGQRVARQELAGHDARAKDGGDLRRHRTDENQFTFEHAGPVLLPHFHARDAIDKARGCQQNNQHKII